MLNFCLLEFPIWKVLKGIKNKGNHLSYIEVNNLDYAIYISCDLLFNYNQILFTFYFRTSPIEIGVKVPLFDIIFSYYILIKP